MKFMHPVPAKAPIVVGEWIFEPKIDGCRCAIEKTDKGIVAHGKEGMRFNLPGNILAGLPVLRKGSQLDAEFFHGGSEATAFSVLSRANPPDCGVLWVHDYIRPKVRPEELWQRKIWLNGIAQEFGSNVQQVFWADGDFWYWYDKFVAEGFEGMVAKRRCSLYRPGYGNDWQKIKPGYVARWSKSCLPNKRLSVGRHCVVKF